MKSGDSYGVIFTLLLDAQQDCLEEGEKRINYVIYICTLKFVLSLKSNLRVYSAIAWNHTTPPTDDSQETLDDFQQKNQQKFLSSSEESRNTDVFLWSCNGKYEKLLLHCKWIYWKVFFPAKGPGCVCTCECVCVPMCVCM